MVDVVHGLMNVFRLERIVSNGFVGVDAGAKVDAVQNLTLQRLTLRVRHNLGAYLSRLTVKHSHDWSLASVAGGGLPCSNL